MTLQETLDILYQDDWLVAVNKPSGLLVHRSMIDRSETRFAMQLLRDQLGQHVFPLHRLDKPTSGVLLFALSSETARQASALFSDRQTAKTYVAVVRGHAPNTGIIDHALKEELDKKTDRLADADKAAQDAVTRFQRLAAVELPIAVDRYPVARYSLVQCHPETGRKHQIRRHMKHISHPVIGDAKHGKSVHNRFFQEHFSAHRLLLAATQLGFTHPITGEQIIINAPLDDTFKRVITALSWQDAVPPCWLGDN